MNVFFQLHHVLLNRDPYPLLLRIYRMTTNPPPKRRAQKGSVRPEDLATEFKRRTQYLLDEDLPADVKRALKRLEH